MLCTKKQQEMKQVISYSLYGNIEKYTIGAIRNAEDIPRYYPGWEGWFYVGKTVPSHIINKLESLGARVIPIDEEENWAATMWRFLVFTDTKVERAIIRDTDSRLSKREATAVKEWVDSDKGFHIMRDHPQHKAVMLAGMWGAKADKLRDIEKMIVNLQEDKNYSVDQLFLQKKIYPTAREDSLIHADFNAYETQAIPFSTKRDGHHFVGEVFDENNIPFRYHQTLLKIEKYSQINKFIYKAIKRLANPKKQHLGKTHELKVVHVATSLVSVSAASRLINAERLLGVNAVALLKNHGAVSFPCHKNNLVLWQKISFFSNKLTKVIKVIFYKLKYLINKKNLYKKNPNLPWNDGVFGEPVHHAINKTESDIAHLHWIASGFPAIKYIHKITQPIIWTFHDVWPVTAGHHCEMDCIACKKDGKNCIEFDKSYSKFPSSEYLWNYKKKYFGKIKNLTIVTPSHWLANITRNSPLFQGIKVFVIPNTVNTNLFRPQDKVSARKKLNLPLDKKIILFSSNGGIEIEYKGYNLLIESLQNLKKKTDSEDFHLVVLGSNNTSNLDLPFPANFLGHIDSETLLTQIYNAADIFVCPSTQDNFPNVLIESLSCGVPCVGFDVGGIPEIIDHKKRGYIAKNFDTKDFADGIDWVLSNKVNYADLSKNSRQFAEENLSYSVVAESHRKLYEKILHRNKPDKAKISIVIPTYNCGQYIKKAIDSVLQQPYPNKELIVIDGDSKDNTTEILKSYGDKIVWVSEKDNGQADAINKGFKMSSGEIVAWLNADDFYEPNIFDTVVKQFEEKGVALVYGKCRSFGDNISIENLPPKSLNSKLLINRGNFTYQPATFFKKKYIESVGWLDDTLNYWMEYDLSIKLLLEGEARYVDLILANFLIRKDQKSNLQNSKEMDQELLKISQRYGGGKISKIYLSYVYRKLCSIFKRHD